MGDPPRGGTEEWFHDFAGLNKYGICVAEAAEAEKYVSKEELFRFWGKKPYTEGYLFGKMVSPSMSNRINQLYQRVYQKPNERKRICEGFAWGLLAELEGWPVNWAQFAEKMWERSLPGRRKKNLPEWETMGDRRMRLIREGKKPERGLVRSEGDFGQRGLNDWRINIITEEGDACGNTIRRGQPQCPMPPTPLRSPYDLLLPINEDESQASTVKVVGENSKGTGATKKTEDSLPGSNEQDVHGKKQATVERKEKKAVSMQFNVNIEEEYMPLTKATTKSKTDGTEEGDTSVDYMPSTKAPSTSNAADTEKGDKRKLQIHKDIEDDDCRLESSRRSKIDWTKLSVLGDFSTENPSWDEVGMRLRFSGELSEILQPRKGISSISEAIVESKLQILTALYFKQCEEVIVDTEKEDMNGKSLTDYPELEKKHKRLLHRKEKFEAWLLSGASVEKEIARGMQEKKDLNDILRETGFICDCLDPFCFEPPKCAAKFRKLK